MRRDTTRHVRYDTIYDTMRRNKTRYDTIFYSETIISINFLVFWRSELFVYSVLTAILLYGLPGSFRFT